MQEVDAEVAADPRGLGGLKSDKLKALCMTCPSRGAHQAGPGGAGGGKGGGSGTGWAKELMIDGEGACAWIQPSPRTGDQAGLGETGGALPASPALPHPPLHPPQVPPTAAPCASSTQTRACGRPPTWSGAPAGTPADLHCSRMLSQHRVSTCAPRLPPSPSHLPPCHVCAHVSACSVEAEDRSSGTPHAFLVICCAVEAGEELLLDYGPEFLRHIR